jgi:transcriptional regulator with XRE-family HTH domain
MFFRAAHFRAARALLDLSQAEVASAAGISLPTLKRLESETSGPQKANSRNVEALARVYTERGILFLFPDRDRVIGVSMGG